GIRDDLVTGVQTCALPISEKLQTDLTVIRMRDNLMETRTRLVTSVRGVVKATGGRLPSSETSSFPQQVSDPIPEPLRPAVAPVRSEERRVGKGGGARGEVW